MGSVEAVTNNCHVAHLLWSVYHCLHSQYPKYPLSCSNIDLQVFKVIISQSMVVLCLLPCVSRILSVWTTTLDDV